MTGTKKLPGHGQYSGDANGAYTPLPDHAPPEPSPPSPEGDHGNDGGDAGSGDAGGGEGG